MWFFESWSQARPSSRPRRTKVAGKFVPSITTEYVPKKAEITEPKDIDDAPLIQDTLKIHNVERYINQRNEISIKFFKTAADDGPFYTQMYSRVGGLICGHKDPMLMKINAQNAVRIILKMRLNGWSSLYVKNGFMRHVFMVRIFE